MVTVLFFKTKYGFLELLFRTSLNYYSPIYPLTWYQPYRRTTKIGGQGSSFIDLPFH